jgi:type I restriction enzyme S subunit
MKFYSEDGIASLRMYNIENGRIVWKDIRRVKLTPEEISEYQLKPGDILVNRVNSRELVGKSAVYLQEKEKCVFEAMNIRLRLKNFVDARFVNYWFQNFSRNFFSLIAPQTVGMASINQEQLGSMPVPFAPLSEQYQIGEEVDRQFSITENIDILVEKILKQSNALMQSVLKKAFQGKLVPQDSNDEPASELLGKIKREKSIGRSDYRNSRNKPDSNQMRLT